jgi:two-component system LytT family response regulator
MNLLRVFTVDDEPLALHRLRMLLQSMPQVAHVGEASSCAEAAARIAELLPDVVLLDIRMRDGDGFEILEAVSKLPHLPAVIFVTAFEHYAVRAFDRAAVDYVLKPIERERLCQAINRAHQRMRALDAEQRVGELQEVVRNLRSAATESGETSYETEFWLRGATGLVRVLIDSVESVSSEAYYVALHTASASHLMRGSLLQFENKIEPGSFLRVHRRWLVRRFAILELRTRGTAGGEILLTSGRKVPVGRAYIKRLRETLRRYHHDDSQNAGVSLSLAG